jgi:hypothetical protein
MIIAIVSLVLGIAGLSGLLWFWPKITVEDSFPLNERDILSTQFVISNESNMSIRNVEPSISIARITTTDGLTINGDQNFRGRLREPNSPENKRVATMRAGEKNTVQFPQSFQIGSNTDFADIAVVVNYRAFFIPCKKRSRFTTVKDADGNLHWRSQPLAK